jgi:GTP-binding protein
MESVWTNDPRRIVEATFRAGATATEQVPGPTGVEIAFAGRSNVGKSSLLNALCQRKNLVRTSSTPGCTRQISFFEVRTKDGAVVTLVDLPGYGYAKRSKQERRAWAGLIEDYLLERPTLKVVASLVDARRGLEPDDEQLFELMRQESRSARPPVSIVTVATKLDKLPNSQRENAIATIRKQAGGSVFGVSTEMPDTLLRLWAGLRRHASVLSPTEAAEEQAKIQVKVQAEE